MRALMIGGTGNISLYVTRKLIRQGWDVTLLNRGSKNDLVPEAEVITCDARDEQAMKAALAGRSFDVVAQFIAYHPDDAARDVRLFTGRAGQYVFVSSASVYQKPPRSPVITESTPASNPYWEYSRNKIACEQLLMRAWDEQVFPVTIVRPSHTYGEGALPLSIHGKKGPWQVVRRVLDRKPVLLPGDGTSLWTVTWSDDFADGFIGLMGNDHALGETVHITGDEALTWNQIYRILSEALERPFLPCHVPSDLLALAKDYDYTGGLLGDKANCVVFDNSKVKRLVPGFTATTRFDQGVRMSLDYLLSHPEKQQPDPDFDRFCDRAVDIMKRAEEGFAAL
ncbi:MAG TPA: SDR family oxidoreductase [Candidatus Limnocylindria bacterium]|nr:SDR family oxidoreductase [Candidatus Limnocylindria bacterium]